MAPVRAAAFVPVCFVVLALVFAGEAALADRLTDWLFQTG